LAGLGAVFEQLMELCFATSPSEKSNYFFDELMINKLAARALINFFIKLDDFVAPIGECQNY